MLDGLLTKEICAACKYCCNYDDSDVWDAPGFTEEEFERNGIEGRFAYRKDPNGFYYLLMEKNDKGEYTCPCLSDNGCMLGEKKPFRCAIWPLYVVEYEGELALALSDVCSQMWKKTDGEIIDGIKERIPEIRRIIKEYPELIEKMHDNYRIVGRFREEAETC